MRALALGAFALCLAAVPAAARDFAVAAQGRQLTMALAGHYVSVPGPLWTEPGEIVAVEKSQFIYRQVADNVESVLLLPLDETLVTWTRMMGILAVEQPGYPVALQTASMLGPMAEDCVPDQMLASSLPALTEGGQEGLLMMCGRYKPIRSAARKCTGGLLVAVVLGSERGAMKVYQEWCTGAFDVRDERSWPVTVGEIKVRASELQRATSFVPMAGEPGGTVDAPVTQP